MYTEETRDLPLCIADVTCAECQDAAAAWERLPSDAWSPPLFPGVMEGDPVNVKMMVVDVAAGLDRHRTWALDHVGVDLRTAREAPGGSGGFMVWVNQCEGGGVLALVRQVASTGMPAAITTRVRLTGSDARIVTFIALPFRAASVGSGSPPMATDLVKVVVAENRSDKRVEARPDTATVIFGPWQGADGMAARRARR